MQQIHVYNTWMISQTLKEIVLNRLIGENSLMTNSTDHVIQRTIHRHILDQLAKHNFDMTMNNLYRYIHIISSTHSFEFLKMQLHTNHKILRRNKSYVMVPKVHTKRRCWSLGLLCKKTSPRVPKVMVFEVNFKIDYLLS